MRARRRLDKEWYIGFLLLVLSFLYLSHLYATLRTGETELHAKAINTEVHDG